MGFRDLLRAPETLRDAQAERAAIQADRTAIEEVRESVNFTESLIAHSLAVAQGTYSPDAGKTAAAEFAAGLIGRCLAVAIVEPEPAALLLTPACRMEIGRRLILRGNYAAWIDVRSGTFKLRTARHFSIVSGGIDARTWRYQLELAAPGSDGHSTLTKQVMQPGVLHVKINEDSHSPWYGTSPLLNAGISADLLARVESKTAEELRGAVGHLLPVPEAMGDDNKKALQHDLGELKGRTALVETQAGGHGQGARSAPQVEWQPKRLGAMVPEAHVQLRNDVGRDVCAALGIPAALWTGTDGGSIREAYRQLLTATLEPFAELITAEFKDKLGMAATLNFRKLAAADVSARARAYGTMIAANVPRKDAALASGLDIL